MKRRKGLKRTGSLKRTPLKRSGSLKRTGGPSGQRFTERYPEDHDGPRYGPVYRRVRDWARQGQCFARAIGYRGPGHEECPAPGVQTGPTAHHTGRDDLDGLLDACGAGHDLAAGLGGRSTVEAFREFLEERGLDLDEMAKEEAEVAAVGGPISSISWRVHR